MPQEVYTRAEVDALLAERDGRIDAAGILIAELTARVATFETSAPQWQPEFGEWAGSRPFHIGWIGDVGNTQAHMEAHIALGFDLMVCSKATPVTLADARTVGMSIIPSQTAENLAAADTETIAWYIVDEPDLKGISPATVIAQCEQVAKNDPTRPRYINFGTALGLGPTEVSDDHWNLAHQGRWGPTGDGDYAEFIDGGDCDLVAWDWYPVAGPPDRPRLKSPTDGSYADLATYHAPDGLASVARGRERAYRLVPSLRRRTFLQWVEAVKYDPLFGAVPTYEQLRFLALSSVIHGAGGILWFQTSPTAAPYTRKLINDAEQSERVRRVNAELRALEPILNASPPVLNGVTITSDGSVDTLVKLVDGRRHLLAANMRNAPTAARFDFPGIDGGFDAVLAPYEVIHREGN